MRQIIRGLVASVFAGVYLCVSVTDAGQEPAVRPASSPVIVEYSSGSLALRGQMFRPAGGGPHPAILFLHGSNQDYTKEAAIIGPLYARHGYVLFFPFRRGQGLSAGRGEWISEPLTREFKVSGAEGRLRLMAQLLATEQTDDVLAALEYLQAQPYVDPARIAVAGNSFGGILAVFSAERAGGIRAVVASAPAAQTWANAPELRERLLSASRNSRVPIYFFQASNDFDLDPTEKLAAAMTEAGKRHVRKIFPAFGMSASEGHSFGYFGGRVGT